MSVCHRRSSHALFKGKGPTGLSPLFKHPFHPHRGCSARASQDSIVSSLPGAHKRTKRSGDNKDFGGEDSVFGPLHLPLIVFVRVDSSDSYSHATQHVVFHRILYNLHELSSRPANIDSKGDSIVF